MIDVPDDVEATVQALKKWCTLHKTDKHSNGDCRAQKELTANNTATTTTPKKRPKGKEKRKTKPRKLKFKSKADKKKFLRSIEDTEGVSVESASSDDEDVVEQSLMQLENVSGDDDDEDEVEGDFHILVLTPDMLKDHDVLMDSILFFPIPMPRQTLIWHHPLFPLMGRILVLPCLLKLKSVHKTLSKRTQPP